MAVAVAVSVVVPEPVSGANQENFEPLPEVGVPTAGETLHEMEATTGEPLLVALALYVSPKPSVTVPCPVIETIRVGVEGVVGVVLASLEKLLSPA